jgi:tetratricopeptide (TPR) repeat protein
MARELVNLRALVHDESPVRDQAEVAVDHDRDRVRRVLQVVQGHPKLLELADAAAADRTRLDAQLAAAEGVAEGPALEAFFRDGESTLEQHQFLAALAAWTLSALAVLPPPARLMAEFVACLEDHDRQQTVIQATWPDLWRSLNQLGDPPGPDLLLDELATAALVQPHSAAAPVPVTYRMHPGVAASARGAVSATVSEATDTVLAAHWRAVSRQAREREGGEESGLIVRAGLAAAPYLLRHGDWDTARTLLDHAVRRDHSPGVVAAALPALRRINAATGTPFDQLVLARAMSTTDPAGAEQLMSGALDSAANNDDDRLASAIAGELIVMMTNAGRLEQALEMAERKADHTRQAGLGPWTQLADENQRLRVLAMMGQHEQVLAETESLRARMADLPSHPGGQEIVVPWNVREPLLYTGYSSALALGRWNEALDLNAEHVTSVQERGAGIYEITSARFNRAGPLIRLDRLEEAGRLLRQCKQVFEEHRDTAVLAKVSSTCADLENARGHQQAAAELEQAALRLGYARPQPASLAISHHNLANYLGAAGGDRAARQAHRLAAGLLFRLVGMTRELTVVLPPLSAELDENAPGALSTVAEVVAVAERTEGVRLGELLAALEPDLRAVEAALAEILRTAAEPPATKDQAGPVTEGP